MLTNHLFFECQRIQVLMEPGVQLSRLPFNKNQLEFIVGC
jgi:hypothetical protein